MGIGYLVELIDNKPGVLGVDNVECVAIGHDDRVDSLDGVESGVVVGLGVVVVTVRQARLMRLSRWLARSVKFSPYM